MPLPPRKPIRRTPIGPGIAISIAPVKRGSSVRKVAPVIPLLVASLSAPLAGIHIIKPATTAGTATITQAAQVVVGPNAPRPLLAKGHPVDWWFVFKLNAGKFPGCGGGGPQTCLFGGSAQSYKVGLRYVYASSEAPSLADGGNECMGGSTNDPVGATYDEVYNGNFHYVVWNDQFLDTDPSAVQNCSKGDCGAPWGHSKGLLAWDDDGEGFVMQVSTPAWPGTGSRNVARKNGNSLGCITGDDNVEVSQHFFALELTKEDLKSVLRAMVNASVVTDVTKTSRVASVGGPADVQELANQLGVKSQNPTAVTQTLTSGVRLISKPSKLLVPPWQMVSSLLGGVPLRTATWWMHPQIPTTTADTDSGCLDAAHLGKSGAVEIATTGTWKGTIFGLQGGHGDQGNHAKLAVSTTPNDHYAIFGDENQQGSLTGDCDSSQNGRGGMFFVMQNAQLSASLAELLAGSTAGTTVPPPSADDKDTSNP